MINFLNRVQTRVLRGILRLLFGVFYARRHGKLGLEKIQGLNLLIPPEVFNPALFGSSPFLAAYLRQHPPAPGRLALDLGCGSGLLGLELARLGAKVTAIDLNPQAVWASRVNARLNGLNDGRYTVYEGNLYEPVAATGQRFDLIVMNPPYYPHTPENLLDHAFQAGPKLEILHAMLSGAAAHLKPGGQALAVISSTVNMDEARRQVERVGLSCEIVARRRYWAEWHLIYRLTRTTPGQQGD